MEVEIYLIEVKLPIPYFHSTWVPKIENVFLYREDSLGQMLEIAARTSITQNRGHYKKSFIYKICAPTN